MPEWVGTLGGYIGLVVFVGAVVVYLRGSRDKGTITTLQQNNDALIERVALLEAGERRLVEEAKAADLLHTAEVAALDLRVAALESENERLNAVRPSAEVLSELATATAALKEQADKHDADIKRLLTKPARKAPT